MPYRYPPEFRHRVLGPIAADLGVGDQAIYAWRRQELIDTGVELGLSSVEAAGLRAAKRRIVALETEPTVTRRRPGGGAVPVSGRIREGQSV